MGRGRIGLGGTGLGGMGPWAHSPPFPTQEHYMASLMPLQKSITPWKVGVLWGPWRAGSLPHPEKGRSGAGGHGCVGDTGLKAIML